MKKIFKILGIIIIIFIVLIGSLVFYIYQTTKWSIDAEDLSGIRFGSPMFNKRLETCSPSFSYRGSYFNEPWEIRGIKNDKCMVYFYELVDTDSEKGEYTEAIHKCRLPYGIYSNPDEIDWTILLNNEEYCYW